MKQIRWGCWTISLLCFLTMVWGCSSSSDGPPGEDQMTEPTTEDSGDEKSDEVSENGDTTETSTEKNEAGEQAGVENKDLASLLGSMNSSLPEAAPSPAHVEQQGSEAAQQVSNAVTTPNFDPSLDSGYGQGGTIQGAAGKPADKGLPELGSKLHYIVKPGETLGKISQKIYGTKGMWKIIAKMSSISNPNLIYPGDVLYYQLNPKTLHFAKKNENVSKSTLTVKKGETLGFLAKKLYGDSHLWKFMWRLNPQLNNPHLLKTGDKIYYEKSFASSAQNKFSVIKNFKLKDSVKRTNVFEVEKVLKA